MADEIPGDGIELAVRRSHTVSMPQSSPDADDPRLLRVTLESMEDVGTVLVSSLLLRNEYLAVRILPDIPWTQWHKPLKDPRSTKMIRDQKTGMIYDIPEFKDDSEWLSVECGCS